MDSAYYMAIMPEETDEITQEDIEALNLLDENEGTQDELNSYYCSTRM